MSTTVCQLTSNFIILLLCALSPQAVLAAESSPGPLYVEIAKAKLRSEPKHWAAGKLDLSYGTQLKEISRSNSWVKVQTLTGVEGYVHDSAITLRKVVLSSGTANAVALKPDESDVVLAGKGFSHELERGIATERKQLNFSAVDKIEQLNVKEKDLARFLVQGKLNDSAQY